jgi:hypothetical protein
VSAREPIARLDTESVATPLLSVTVPSVVPPSLKVMLPAGVPVPGLTTATAAVRVTAWPDTEGFGVEFRVVVVEAWFTTIEKGAEVLVEKFASRHKRP